MPDESPDDDIVRSLDQRILALTEDIIELREERDRLLAAREQLAGPLPPMKRPTNEPITMAEAQRRIRERERREERLRRPPN